MTRVLAIDVGTTAAKAALFDDVQVVAGAAAPLPIEHPAPGWAEQDPRAWWSATVTAVRGLGDVGPVDAVAVTGQMQDLVAVDGAGEPLRPAILYADQRATAEHQALAGALGPAWEVAVGSEPDATNVAAKWRWLRTHEPATVAATAVVLVGAHSAVVGRLTGVLTADATTAATTGLYDLRSGRWWAPVVDAVGIPVPVLTGCTVVAGACTPEAASTLGIAAGVPVVHACGDAVATTIGLVGDEPGRPYAYLGTSGWVAVATTGPVQAPGVIALPGLHDRHWLAVAPVLTAGAAADWARAVLFDGLGPDAFDHLAGAACAAAEGVVFLPHLDGVRSPSPDPDATGVLLGVRRSTSRATVAAAVYEGVAHALRAIAERVAPDAEALAVCGGGARSAVWCQVLADVCGVPVRTVDDEHAALRGAATCARLALGRSALPAVGSRATLVPDPARHAAHRAVSGSYDALVPVLGPTFAALARARAANDLRSTNHRGEPQP